MITTVTGESEAKLAPPVCGGEISIDLYHRHMSVNHILILMIKLIVIYVNYCMSVNNKYWAANLNFELAFYFARSQMKHIIHV